MQVPGSALVFQVDGAQAPRHEKTLTFDQPVGDLPIVDDARWSASVTDHSLTALLIWVVLLITLQAVSWPLVRRLFTRFPDRGWSFARLVTLLIAGFSVWFLASVELIAFRAIWAGVALALTALLSFGIGRVLREPSAEPPFWKNPVIVAAELVFWGVFALFLLYRALNPDSYHPIWGGEKPMEFAHLNAILRSAHFPPVDPWYSGGYINYYYYGTYLVAFLVKLTGIPSEIAFNLAQPTIVALLAMGAFGLSAALGRRLTGSVPGSILTGLLGVFFISFAGNLIAAARVFERFLDGFGPVNPWSYWVWQPTRAIPSPDVETNITEFPYFAGLYADLHPHVIAMPITILVIALSWQLASSWRFVPVVTTRLRTHRREAAQMAILLLLAALALGSLFMTNAWDLPMYVAVLAVGVLMATKGIASIARRLLLSGLALGAVGLLAYALILPFTTHYVALFGEIGSVNDRTPLLAIESHVGGQLLVITVGMVALLSARITVRRRIIDPILPLGLLVVVLLVRWIAAGRADDTLIRLADGATVLVATAIWLIAAALAIGRRVEFALPSLLLRWGVLAAWTTVAMLVGADRMVLGLYLGLGLAAGILWLALSRPSERFVAALVAGATLLGAALELVYLVDDLDGGPWYRMNTIFKFYNQVWVLLGIATAALAGRAVWRTVQVLQQRLTVHRPVSELRWTTAAAGLTGAIMIAALAYPVVATPIRLEQDFAQPGRTLTLDAYHWMTYGQIQLGDGAWVGYADDLAAIDWLNEHVAGTPVIAEASFGPYRCNGSRFSIATGLPAVIGWQRHEQQQRYLDDLWQREQDLRALYTDPSVSIKQEIIERYDIAYIIVGETERHYPIDNSCAVSAVAEGIEGLEAMVGTTLEVAFTHGTTTIYRVVTA